MRALVVMPTAPALGGRDRSGIYRRLSVSMQAVASVASQVDVVHFASEMTLQAFESGDCLDKEQSDYWGFPVSVSIIPSGSRDETFYSYYIAGITRASRQKRFFPFTGAAQVSALRAHLDCAPDLLFVSELEAMLPVMATGCRPRRVFFDMVDVVHHSGARSILNMPWGPGKLALLAQIPAIMAAERRALAYADTAFVSSDLERTRLAAFGMARNVVTIQNSLAVPLNTNPLSETHTIMFIGTYDYGPNEEAALRLLDRILPLVRHRVPDVRLLIAGKGSERLAAKPTNDCDVEYLGFVEDLDALYRRTRVVCCPIDNGGGTRIKLIEAAAFAKPMVSTRIGAEGLGFVDGEHILLRESDAEIADACVQFLLDDALCVRLGEAARKAMRARYDASVIRDALIGRMREALG